MSATLNVFGNVREYDTDLDVFGNAFEWEAPSGIIVSGCLNRRETYAPGFDTSCRYQPGLRAQDVYRPGFDSVQKGCC